MPSLKALVLMPSTSFIGRLPRIIGYGGFSFAGIRVRDFNSDLAETARHRRKKIRLPIIINGAGPAGLTLAIGLKKAQIPFEICESKRYDLPSRQRRNHVAILSQRNLDILSRLLQTPDSKLLSSMVIFEQAKAPDNVNIDQPIHTEALMEILRHQTPVHYGFRLEKEGISCLESVVTSRFREGEYLREFQGSLVVGADGIFSAGKICTVRLGYFIKYSCSQRPFWHLGLACHHVRLDGSDITEVL